MEINDLELLRDQKSYIKKTHDFIYLLSVFFIIPILIIQAYFGKTYSGFNLFIYSFPIYFIFLLGHFYYRSYKLSTYVYSLLTLILISMNYFIKGGFEYNSIIWNVGLIFIFAILFKTIKEVIFCTVVMVFFMILSEYLIINHYYTEYIYHHNNLHLFRLTSFVIVSVFFIYIISFYKKVERQYRKLLISNFEFNQILLGVLYHDISTHLSSLLMRIDLLPKEHGRIKIIANDLKLVVDNVRNLEKIRYSKLNSNVVSVDIEDIIGKTLSTLEDFSFEKQIKYDFEYNHHKAKVLAEESSLRVSVLGNILSNAVKFSENGGRVIIRTYSDGEYVFIEIEDFAGGINEQLHQDLFKYRINSTLVEGCGTPSGNGFGLPIAKSFCKLYGGDLDFKLTKEGTTFILRFLKV